MYLEQEKLEKVYYRTSKLGKVHRYVRTLTILKLQCDNCLSIFFKEKGRLSPKRLDNKYYHCCTNCDSKRFAQKKGSEKRSFWNIPVSSSTPIDRL
jgi:hypothetical protein